jgi:hypothetical protein
LLFGFIVVYSSLPGSLAERVALPRPSATAPTFYARMWQ